MAGKFEIYNDKAGEFRFRLKSSDGKNILSSEGYKNKAGCTNGIESVKKNASDDGRYERKESDSGKFSFNLKAANSQVIGVSQSYESEDVRDNVIASVKSDGPTATVDDTTG